MKLSRMMTGLLAVALMSFMVSDVMAQGRPRGGGPPGGGRPGGFGGRGGPGGGGGGADAIIGLLRVDAVKVEIELTPDQDEACAKLMQPGERPQINFREMSEEERQEAFAKMQKEREERVKKQQEQLEEVLLPQQMDRLKEIALQLRGVRALADDDVAKELKITAAQKTKLEEVQEQIGQEMRSKMQELFQSGDRDAMREAFTKMREESETQVLAVLTGDQKTQFEKMKGKKFDMPEGAVWWRTRRTGRWIWWRSRWSRRRWSTQAVDQRRGRGGRPPAEQ